MVPLPRGQARTVPPALAAPSVGAGGTTRRHATDWTGIAHQFEDVRMQRKDLGYRRLYSCCWAAHLAGDLPALLQLAADPSLTPDMVATIAPGASDCDADVELAGRILAHPACSAGVASRFATYRDVAIRVQVARFPGLLTSTLAVLAVDVDEAVRAAAVAALDDRVATMTGD